jgi:hypothetical protein
VAAHSPSFRSTRKASCRIRSRYFGGILPRYWIRIGTTSPVYLWPERSEWPKGKRLGRRGGFAADVASRNPFNDRIVSSASEDGKIMIWRVPQGFTLHVEAEEMPHVDPVAKLSGHPRYDPSLLHFPVPLLGRPANLHGATEKSARSSSTPPPKTSSPRPRATSPSSSGTYRRASQRISSASATWCRACLGTRRVLCS